MASDSPYAPPASNSDTAKSEATGDLPSDQMLLKNRSFLGLAITQFLGAFNDNVYKQIVLLLAIPMAVVATQQAGGEGGDAAGGDVQGWATAIFSLPFVLFSGFAGYLSDKYSKRTVIVLSKIAEILIMLASLLAFLAYDWFGMAGTWIVLFAMATQSTFFGPGKYGILPELFAKKRLASANGLILMSTFLAIIMGTLAAGAIFDWFAVPGDDGYPVANGLWKGAAVCIGIAIAGTLTALAIVRTRPAEPTAKLEADTWWVNKDIRRVLWQDKPLLSALLVSCVFWLISGICVPVINRVGLLLEVSKFQTSILLAAIALGIMIGSAVPVILQYFGGISVKNQISVGLWGMFATLATLAIWTGNALPLLPYWGIFTVLLLLGIFVATYAIPLQVFLQDRPPDQLKGRMIATMNQANFIGILLSGPIYQVCQNAAASLGVPINAVFGMMALLLLPIAIFYRLNDNPV